MKKLERLFRKIGSADVHVWGYSTPVSYTHLTLPTKA